MALILALGTSSHQPVSELSSQNHLPCRELPRVGEFILEKSKFGGPEPSQFLPLHSHFPQSHVPAKCFFPGDTGKPLGKGMLRLLHPSVGTFHPGKRLLEPGGHGRRFARSLFPAVSSPVNCWGLGSTTNGGPAPAEDSRPVKIPPPGCKTSTET